jgi:Integrase core domain
MVEGAGAKIRGLAPGQNPERAGVRIEGPSCVAEGIGTALIEPAKIWQNCITERFDGKFRYECLSLERLRSRAEANNTQRGALI